MADEMRIKMLSAEEVMARQQDGAKAVLLDVREEEEWEEVHIPGATWIPMSSLRARLRELDPQRETIVICEHGLRSQAVAQFLVAEAGFVNVGNLVGGMSVWPGPTEAGE